MNAALLFAVSLAAQDVDLSKYDPAGGVRVTRTASGLRAEWPAGGGRAALELRLAGEAPLFEALELDGAVLARNVRPLFVVTTGSRTERANERYLFFDKPASRPHQRHEAALEIRSARVESAGRRSEIRLSRLSAGPFAGELVIRLYDGSPLVHLEAALGLDERRVAYIYDFLLAGDFPGFAWKDLEDRFVRAAPEGDPQPVAVRNRAIFAETGTGTLAVFPPPHAFFYPRDYTTNYKFVQAGRGRFGLRQDPAGGPGHEGMFIPWFDAPAGRTQRMGAFVLLHRGKAEEALDRVKRYTNGDSFKPMDGRLAMSSHWHARLTVSEMAGRPRAPEFVRVFKDLGIDIVHLAEFHGDGTPRDPGPKRLPELKAMFDLCRTYSDDRILLLPGEEANAHLNTPAPPNQPPGHWIYLFPKPVYLTLVRPPGTPFEEEVAPYGRVYRAGSEKDMIEILRREKGLAWTAHPRIKSSFTAPDAYKDREWFKDDSLWLGGAWKAMPGDLSDGRGPDPLVRCRGRKGRRGSRMDPPALHRGDRGGRKAADLPDAGNHGVRAAPLRVEGRSRGGILGPPRGVGRGDRRRLHPAPMAALNPAGARPPAPRAAVAARRPPRRD